MTPDFPVLFVRMRTYSTVTARLAESTVTDSTAYYARVALCLRSSACITEKHARNRSLRAHKELCGHSKQRDCHCGLLRLPAASILKDAEDISHGGCGIVGLLFVDEGIYYSSYRPMFYLIVLIDNIAI